MFDAKTEAVMAYINALTEDGTYQIIDAADVAHDLSAAGVDLDTLQQIVSFLAQREYVSVKYADGDEYCLTALPKGRIAVAEQKPLPKRTIGRRELTQFAIAFLGAAAGTAVVLLLAALLF